MHVLYHAHNCAVDGCRLSIEHTGNPKNTQLIDLVYEAKKARLE